MRREIRIFADKHTDNQVTENSKTEAHSNPLWSVDRRGAGQQFSTEDYSVVQYSKFLYNIAPYNDMNTVLQYG